MIWLTWRQFRVQALALAIPLAVLAVALIWTEPGLAHLRRLSMRMSSRRGVSSSLIPADGSR